MSKCNSCDGDGYQEKFNDDQSDVITWLCPDCSGTGEVKEYLPPYDLGGSYANTSSSPEPGE